MLLNVKRILIIQITKNIIIYMSTQKKVVQLILERGYAMAV